MNLGTGRILTIQNLPEDVLLIIFSYLTPSELALCSGTSSHWYSLCTLPVLWKNVSFVEKERLSLRQLSHFVSTHVAQFVESMTIEGYVRRNNFAGNSTSIVSKTVLNKISRHMISLKKLKIDQANITNVNLAMFPKRLETLSLFSCIIDEKFANNRNFQNKRIPFENLKNLDFPYVHKLDARQNALRNFTWLESIDVTHCFRLTKLDLLDWSKHMKMLKNVNISELREVDDEVFLAFASLKRILSLSAAYTRTSNIAIESMSADRIQTLRFLDIRGCTNITGDVLKSIVKSTNIDEIRIHRNMIGFVEARQDLSSAPDRHIRVLDEVDTGAFAIPLCFERIQQIRGLNCL